MSFWYCDAIEKIHAPGDLRERVKHQTPTVKINSFIPRKLAYTAAALAVLFLSGNVVSYAATGSTLIGHFHRSTFFYPNREAADVARRADGSNLKGASTVLTSETDDADAPDNTSSEQAEPRDSVQTLNAQH